MLYVLMKTEDSGGGTPLGVFDTPNINDQEIYEYFGVFNYSRNEDFIDIRDSGLEWQLTITTADKEKHILTLHYFVLNEI